MIALLMVMLGASAMISTMAATRVTATRTAKFSAAHRLAAELSDWTRQGGLRALTHGMDNPFDLVDASDTAPNCFNSPCAADDAALFYLYHWRRRLLLEVGDARVVVCHGVPPTRADQYAWDCDEDEPGSHSRVIKIGWPQGSLPGVHKFPPRLILALG